MTLTDLARSLGAGSDSTAQPPRFYELYARYFPDNATPATLLELGVHAGVSLKIWASYFKNGKVIGLDLADPGPDFAAYPNIVYEPGDQADAARLAAISDRHAPDGFDIIIDDASHVGVYALASYSILFPRLKPGGLYVIEDWATGYYDDWPDGGHYQKISVEPVDGLPPKRIPSHDLGMVGFVKSLVDEAAGENRRPGLTAPMTRRDTIDFLHVYKEFAILRKCDRGEAAAR